MADRFAGPRARIDSPTAPTDRFVPPGPSRPGRPAGPRPRGDPDGGVRPALATPGDRRTTRWPGEKETRMTSAGAGDASQAPESPCAESVFAEVRPRLFGIAYRRVGDVGEAEDIVQDAWIRWQTCDRSTVRDPRAFLAATTARLSSNAVQAARARHETYVGAWVPEPADATWDPALAAERAEAIELAVRLTLEKLSPSERAAYVLRHAFDYPYERIAEIVQQTQASARQLVSRSRKRLTGAERAAVSPGEHRQLVEAFLAGARSGDLTALEQLFAADVRHGAHRRLRVLRGRSSSPGGPGCAGATDAARRARARVTVPAA